MNLFKEGVVYGAVGALVGMVMGALMLFLSFLLSGSFFELTQGDEGAQPMFAIAMSVGSFAGAVLGALSGILDGYRKK